MTNPFTTIINARNSLDTATNYLGDAIGALVVEDVPVTREQADERMADVERHVRDAERELDRAKHHLGIGGRDETDDAETPLSEAHLVCTQCESHVTVARVHGDSFLVCHCTHIDGAIESPALSVIEADDMTPLPDPWEFQGVGE